PPGDGLQQALQPVLHDQAGRYRTRPAVVPAHPRGSRRQHRSLRPALRRRACRGPAAPATAPRRSRGAGRVNASRILIVDDEPDMRWVIKGLFDDDEYEFAEASNGREGIQAVESWQPDVVLTDVVMPDVDGQELLRQCQHLDAELPVILISAVEDIDVAVAAMKEGAFDYMAKPFDSERLRVTTRRAIEQRRLR